MRSRECGSCILFVVIDIGELPQIQIGETINIMLPYSQFSLTLLVFFQYNFLILDNFLSIIYILLKRNLKRDTSLNTLVYFLTRINRKE